MKPRASARRRRSPRGPVRIDRSAHRRLFRELLALSIDVHSSAVTREIAEHPAGFAAYVVPRIDRVVRRYILVTGSFLPRRPR